MPESGAVDLARKKCRPCEGGAMPLTPEEAARLSGSVPDWNIEENLKLKKEFCFKDFIGAMAFVNYVAAIAESEQHHPAILISYSKVKMTLFTHAINGLSENDFIMAAKINEAQAYGGSHAC
jgi:pterin-4a-carbinolamine dehydratase